MRSMMERLANYLDEKRLTLNVNKTKIMRFRKGGGRWKKVEKWRGRKIEEVREFTTYLGYVLQRNGGQEAHIRESQNSSSNNGAGMGDREEEIWK